MERRSHYTDIALVILHPKPITQAQKLQLDRLVKTGKDSLGKRLSNAAMGKKLGLTTNQVRKHILKNKSKEKAGVAVDSVRLFECWPHCLRQTLMQIPLTLQRKKKVEPVKVS